MAAWRRAIELSLADADLKRLKAMAQSRTEPAMTAADRQGVPSRVLDHTAGPSAAVRVHGIGAWGRLLFFALFTAALMPRQLAAREVGTENPRCTGGPRQGQC
jgi:hypothetical protein